MDAGGDHPTASIGKVQQGVRKDPPKSRLDSVKSECSKISWHSPAESKSHEGPGSLLRPCNPDVSLQEGQWAYCMGPQKLPPFWSHIPDIVMVPHVFKSTSK